MLAGKLLVWLGAGGSLLADWLVQHQRQPAQPSLPNRLLPLHVPREVREKPEQAYEGATVQVHFTRAGRESRAGGRACGAWGAARVGVGSVARAGRTVGGSRLGWVTWLGLGVEYYSGVE